jgi:hypothetical protein
MEVTQRLQLVQDEAFMIFEEIEGQGSQLDQVVATVEKCLEGPVTEQVIQEFAEHEVLVVEPDYFLDSDVFVFIRVYTP